MEVGHHIIYIVITIVQLDYTHGWRSSAGIVIFVQGSSDSSYIHIGLDYSFIPSLSSILYHIMQACIKLSAS